MSVQHQQPVVIGNAQSDPAVWIDRLSAVYESVSRVLRLFCCVYSAHLLVHVSVSDGEILRFMGFPL